MNGSMGRRVAVGCVGLLVVLVVAGVARAALPSVVVSEVTAPLTNNIAHTGVTETANCSSGTLVGGGTYLRNASSPSTLPTNGLVLGGVAPSAGSSPVDVPVGAGGTDPTSWLGIANFTGVAELGDEAEAFALCATGGTAHTVVATQTTTAANATQEVNPPVLTIATCPSGTTLIGGGAVTSGAGQTNDGVTTGNSGNLKPVGDYPSDHNGVAAVDGSTGATSWTAYGASGIPASSDAVTAYAFCSTDPAAPPVQVARTDVSGPNGQAGTTLDTASATCPTATRLVGGGYEVDESVGATDGLQPQQGYHMRGSYPTTDATNGTEVANGAANPTVWTALLQAGGQSLQTANHMNLRAFAMCATAPSAPASLSTQASPSVGVGGVVTDAATLSGGTSPTGSVAFDLYGPGDTGCSSPVATSTDPISGDGTYQSAPFTAPTAGTYRWVASYSGDDANPATAGTCGTTGESVVVTAAAPSISTLASPALAKTGTQISDTATLSGGATPGGSITFSVYSPSQPACATAMRTFSVAVSGNGSYKSPAFGGTSTAGTYRWIASYGGDANNAPVSGHCGDSGESVTIIPATTLSTAAAGPVTIGGQISDTATLGGGSSPTGTITFNVFGPGDTACATPLATSTETVTGDGIYQSATFTPAATGAYRWIASYGGDPAGNAAISGTCGATGETSQVTLPPAGGSVYVGNGSGANAGIAQYTIATDGTITPKNPAIAPGNPEASITVTPDLKYVYGVANNTLSQYRIGSAGVLAPNTPATVAIGVDGMSNSFSVAASPDDRDVYVVNDAGNSGANEVAQYTINADGTLSPNTAGASVPTATNPLTIGLSPDGRFAYVTDDSGLSQYVVNADGTLSPNPDAASVPTGASPSAIAFSPDGRYAYVTDRNDDAVSQYTANADGTLSPDSPATAPTGSMPFGIVVSPDGGSVYVANSLDTTISQYTVNSDGTLSPKTPPTATETGVDGPFAVGISSDGRGLYAADNGSSNTAQFAVGDQGALSPDSTPTLPSGNDPDSIVVTPNPSLSTVASPATQVGDQISATTTLAGGSTPTGTITFDVYGPGDTSCSTPLAASTATVAADGTYSSAAFTATQPGVYTWTAAYGGDSGNEAVGPTSCSSPVGMVSVSGAPGVSTGTASNVTGTAADLAGTVTPNGSTTAYVFEYGTSLSFGAITSPAIAAPADFAPHAETGTVSGLSAGTTYYYRLVATNADGTTFGSVASFTTPGPAVAPAAITQAPVSIGNTSAALGATVNPEGQATAYTFEYGTTTSFGSITPVVELDSANAPETVSSTASGLAQNTTYLYRVVASNAAGTTVGVVRSFTTGPVGPPTASTGSATGVTGTAAVLSGTVNPDGSPTGFAFEYGTTTQFGSLSTIDSTGQNDGAQSVSLSLTGLTPNTTYVYRLVATNANGTAAGALGTFTTGPGT
ncbi:MAG TPA: beta-propeller fold lactonase family protein [Solirubrobacteraceae bacterium]